MKACEEYNLRNVFDNLKLSHLTNELTFSRKFFLILYDNPILLRQESIKMLLFCQNYTNFKAEFIEKSKAREIL